MASFFWIDTMSGQSVAKIHVAKETPSQPMQGLDFCFHPGLQETRHLQGEQQTQNIFTNDHSLQTLEEN